jgi:hypothetical protein
MMALRPCPFCGETDEIKVVTQTHKMARLDGTHDRMALAYVRCGHCAARGTSMIEDTREEAVASATRYWNEAGRPTWWQRNVVFRWGQLCYDIRMIFTGGYDLKLLWKGIWR